MKSLEQQQQQQQDDYQEALMGDRQAGSIEFGCRSLELVCGICTDGDDYVVDNFICVNNDIFTVEDGFLVSREATSHPADEAGWSRNTIDKSHNNNNDNDIDNNLAIYMLDADYELNGPAEVTADYEIAAAPAIAAPAVDAPHRRAHPAHHVPIEPVVVGADGWPVPPGGPTASVAGVGDFGDGGRDIGTGVDFASISRNVQQSFSRTIFPVSISHLFVVRICPFQFHEIQIFQHLLIRNFN